MAYAGTETNAWQWQRIIQIAVPGAEQCIVLDGDLYAHAAAGLRDVRLVQDDRELPYALEESYDAGYTPGFDGDRSQFTTVVTVALSPAPTPQHTQTLWQGRAVLPRGVPVERILLVQTRNARSNAHDSYSKQGPVDLRLTATPGAAVPVSDTTLSQSEVIEAKLAGANPSLLTAVGANLQQNAAISVELNAGEQPVAAILLQMRQRSLCFQPLSAEPLRLLFGNSLARPVRYDFARQYRPIPLPLLAQLGPLQPNPAYHRPLTRRALPRVQVPLLLVGLLAALLLLLLPPIVARRR